MKKSKHFFHLFLLGILAIFLSFGQLERIQVTSQVAFYLHDVLLVFWIATSFQLLTPLLKKNISWLSGFFSIWIVLGILVNGIGNSGLLTAVLYCCRLLTYLVFGELLLDLVRKKLLTHTQILCAVLFTGVMMLYFGFLQYIFIPDTRILFFLGWDDHYYRLISTLLDPGFAGIMLVLTFCAAQMIEQKKFKKLFSVLLLFGILLTYSRASYLTLAFVLGIATVTFWLQKNLFVSAYLVYLCVFLTAIPFLPRPGGEGIRLERTSTITARTAGIVQNFQSMEPKEWITGKGLFLPIHSSQTLFGQPDHAVVSSNWIIFVLIETGLPGWIAFFLIIFTVLKNFWKKNVWLFLAFCAILIHGLFNATIIYPFVVLFLVQMNAAGSEFSRDTRQ